MGRAITDYPGLDFYVCLIRRGRYSGLVLAITDYPGLDFYVCLIRRGRYSAMVRINSNHRGFAALSTNNRSRRLRRLHQLGFHRIPFWLRLCHAV